MLLVLFLYSEIVCLEWKYIIVLCKFFSLPSIHDQLAHCFSTSIGQNGISKLLFIKVGLYMHLYLLVTCFFL